MLCLSTFWKIPLAQSVVCENDSLAIFDSLIFLNHLWSSKMRLCQWAFLQVGKVHVLGSREM